MNWNWDVGWSIPLVGVLGYSLNGMSAAITLMAITAYWAMIVPAGDGTEDADGKV